MSDKHAALLADYAAGEPITVLRARYRLSPKTIYWIANAAKVYRPAGWSGPKPRRRTGEEETVPTPGQPLRPPVLPWYTEHPDPTPPPLAALVVTPRHSPRGRHGIALWPRGAHEEALCIG